jgi:hypothetical protein
MITITEGIITCESQMTLGWRGTAGTSLTMMSLNQVVQDRSLLDLKSTVTTKTQAPAHFLMKMANTPSITNQKSTKSLKRAGEETTAAMKTQTILNKFSLILTARDKRKSIKLMLNMTWMMSLKTVMMIGTKLTTGKCTIKTNKIGEMKRNLAQEIRKRVSNTSLTKETIKERKTSIDDDSNNEIFQIQCMLHRAIN